LIYECLYLLFCVLFNYARAPNNTYTLFIDNTWGTPMGKTGEEDRAWSGWTTSKNCVRQTYTLSIMVRDRLEWRRVVIYALDTNGHKPME